MSDGFIWKLTNILGEDAVKFNEPLSIHTTFRIGGPADIYVLPKTAEALCEAVRLCRSENIPYYLLGKGSNLLVSDRGYRGVMISTDCLSACRIERPAAKSGADQENGNIVMTAGAGISLAALARQAKEESLTGLEFAAGIPGTLGGAVVMNAGAYGSQMADVLMCAKVLAEDGQIHILTADELELGYRTSCIPKRGYVVLEASVQLTRGNQQEIQARMDDLAFQRKSKQPLEYPSAGSMFKRPVGYFAGKLIDDAGLRGFLVGGAQVSEKHCGFVVNRGGATARDVLTLCDEVSRIVYEKFGIRLEREVKYLE